MKIIIYNSLLILIFGCNTVPVNKKPSGGKDLAKVYCGSCHAFPEPGLLDRETWLAAVLPPMAEKLGIDYIYNLKLKQDTGAIDISLADWQNILAYYADSSPVAMPSQQRNAVTQYSGMFDVVVPQNSTDELPATTFIKIDEGNQWIYVANAFDSSFNIYNAALKLINKNKVQGTVVDMAFDSKLPVMGERNGLLTNIGMLAPNDDYSGTIDSFCISKTGKLSYLQMLADSLPRPVQTIKLNNGMNRSYVVCGFGNQRAGMLLQIKKPGTVGQSRTPLLNFPGAIKAYLQDFNHDGLTDIIVLVAQSREGIYLLINKGNDVYETKQVLSFPPVYGSSYFELHDFNGDGHPDILYTCGDNADYSYQVLKPYHGIYIFLNDGMNNFKQQYFFSMHGCFKALAADYDKDGDLDIAAISFFPDTLHALQESFIYLQQKAAFVFEPSIIKQLPVQKWLTMDTGDVDGDGDIDIVLGAMLLPGETNGQTGDDAHPFVLLKNNWLKQ